MRGESWSRPAIIRMTNVSLEPDPAGPRSLAELVADTGRRPADDHQPLLVDRRSAPELPVRL
jgi:hypothetical protein